MIRFTFNSVFLVLVLLISVSGRAGPLMPCVVAAASSGGNVLVINELTYDDPDESHARYPQTSTFRVLLRHVDPNEGLRINGPNTYWADSLWSIVFTRTNNRPITACPYILVTDDGEYVVLFGHGYWGPAALSIYRRRDHTGQPFGGPGPDHGVFVRDVPLSELWPHERIPEMITDHTAQWFSDGSFLFSADNRKLTYKPSRGGILQIDLRSGKIDLRGQP